MKKKYFVYAYDGMYGGLHGMHEWCFMEGTYDEAECYGEEMSANVIDSYSDIRYSLFDCEDEEIYERYSEEEINEIIQEDIAFEIYEVRDDAPSFEELEAMYLDPESYIKEYCQLCQD